MPSLGADMTEGTLLHWLVRPGDTVRAGDVIAEVDTTKSAIEIECFETGVIGTILVPEGRTVPVGTALATIESADQAVATAPEPQSGTEESSPVPTGSPVSGSGQQANGAGSADATATHDFRATPLIRRLAAEAGIDLTAVRGSGPHGRIMRADIDAAVAACAPARPTAPVPEPGSAAPAGAPVTSNAAAPRESPPSRRASGYARRLAAEAGVDWASLDGSGPGGAVRARDVRAAIPPESDAVRPAPGPAAESVTPPTSAATRGGAVAGATSAGGRDRAAIRRQIAAAMTRSKRTVPHYYLSDDIDVDAAVRRLRETNTHAPVADRIVPSALLLCAAARAAATVGELNGHWIGDEFRPAPQVHLGVVVSLRGGGILLPTIPDADQLPAAAMMAALRGVVARAREGRLRSSDTVDATISVTALGEPGVRAIFGVVPAPQVAILGFGAVTEHPCVVGGSVEVRSQVTVTLSADHRASDGALGARLLATVGELLRHPEEL
ncbi:dihydrolipoamide acetyltransferase family protein [Nocardia sp. NPDC003345]